MSFSGKTRRSTLQTTPGSSAVVMAAFRSQRAGLRENRSVGEISFLSMRKVPV